jgi:tetratricopeptide (TPR) repeat protein
MRRIIIYSLFLWMLLLQNTALVAQKTMAFSDPAREFKEALEIYDQQKYNIAYNRFISFIESYEELNDSRNNMLLADAYYYKASCAAYQKDPKTESYYLAYLDRFKGHSFANNAYNDLGNWYFAQNNFKDALSYYNKVNERALSKKFYEEFSFKRGFCHFSLKNFEAAKTAWIEVTNAKDSEYYEMANYYYGLASYYDKEYDNAVVAFKKIEKDPKYKNVIPYYITQIYFQEKQYQEVINYAEPIIEQKSIKNKAEINQLVGQSYFELKNYKSSVQYLEAYEKEAKSLSKEDYYQLGYAQYQVGEYAKAVENFKQLNHLNDALAQNALYLSGNAYLKLNDKENARNALLRASSLNFDAAIVEESKFNYAKISYELNYINDALVAIRKFIADYPNSKYIDEANEVLANVLLSTRNYDEALTIIEGMKNPSPKIQGVYQLMAYQKAIAQYNSGNITQSLESLNKAQRYTPDKNILSLTHYWRADILHQKDEYDKSISEMNLFLPAAKTLSSEHKGKVSEATGRYVQGYNYYKKKDYAKARAEFEMAANQLASNTNADLTVSLLPDALLRTADCYFLEKNYNASINFYEKVIAKAYEGSDYAFFQKGIIEGLKGNDKAKIDQMNRVISGYPQSVLVDDARYEIGNTLVDGEKYDEAITTFNELIQKHPKSEWIAPAYLRLGLVYFNRAEYDKSLVRYKLVVTKYPKSAASAEALTAIKDVYIAMGDPNGYIKYVGTVPNASVTVSQQDSVVYLSAENLFTKGQYDKALLGFNDYLVRFPKGYFNISAHFYRGECHFSFQDFNKALADYDKVLAEDQNRFLERSYARAAGINYYHTKNYEAARTQYTNLIQQASTDESRMSATIGLLRTSFQLKDYTNAIQYANQVVANDGFSEMQHTEAYYYRAKSYWETGNTTASIADYQNVRSRTTNEWAAEGAYFMAKNLKQQNKLPEAEKACFEFIRNYPSYATWLVQTYLLLADIYVAQGNLFKAKATVQSILDNYTKEDEWRSLALAKYAEIEAMEAENSKIALPDEDDSQLKFDEN